MDFKAGDIVVLKSGGPKMTIKSFEKDAFSKGTLVKCVWFDDNNKQKQKMFVPESLMQSLENDKNN